MKTNWYIRPKPDDQINKNYGPKIFDHSTNNKYYQLPPAN